MRTALRKLLLKKAWFLPPIILCMSLFTIRGQEIIDKPVPGADGTGICMHIQPGNGERDFHVTYETGDAYYVYFDGTSWGTPVKIGSNAFRSGYKMGIDSKGDVHFAWGESERGDSKYRMLSNGVLSSPKNVITSNRWSECDIAVGTNDNVYMIGSVNGWSNLGLFKKDGSNWTKDQLPGDNGWDYWC